MHLHFRDVPEEYHDLIKQSFEVIILGNVTKQNIRLPKEGIIVFFFKFSSVTSSPTCAKAIYLQAFKNSRLERLLAPVLLADRLHMLASCSSSKS